MPQHHYQTTLTWSDERGTVDYRGYPREHEVVAVGRPVLLGSADKTFRGDPTRWNPELLLLAALSECHLLSYLSVCALARVVVTGYTDDATGTMLQEGTGGRFSEVVLRPRVSVSGPAMVDQAIALHQEAHRQCFIANSVNFPVRHEAQVLADTMSHR